MKTSTVQASIERRQRTLLRQIAEQRAIAARAEARIAELTGKLLDAAPTAYSKMLEKRAADILQRKQIPAQ